MRDLKKLLSKKSDTTGDFIKALRKNFNVTQNELCKITGISQSYLSSVENNAKSISLDSAIKISIFFNISPVVMLFPHGTEKLHLNYPEMHKRAKSFLKEKERKR